MIRCIAIDDEPLALEKLNGYIERIPYLDLVASCEDITQAMKVIEAEKVDLAFIDINMPDVNGIEFIRSLANPPMVVFVTAYAEYAVDSYKVRAVDYILKPYDFEDFQRASANVYRQWKLQNDHQTERSVVEPGVIYFKVDYRYLRVVLDDILYIEGMSEYLKIKTVSDDPFLTHTTFRQINEALPDNFVQVHRSYVVNMKHIKEIERSVILMSDGAHISISDSNKDIIMQYLQKHGIKKN